MFKNTVVIPLDGSEYSARILPAVHKHLPTTENRLILLRVCKDSPGMVGIPQSPAAAELNTPVYRSHRDAVYAQHPIYASQIQESQRAEVTTELSEIVGGLKTLGYEVAVEVAFGDPAEEIVNFVTLTDVDLIAMATHGRTGLNKLLFGNVGQRAGATFTSVQALSTLEVKF